MLLFICGMQKPLQNVMTKFTAEIVSVLNYASLCYFPYLAKINPLCKNKYTHLISIQLCFLRWQHYMCVYQLSVNVIPFS